MRVVLIVVLFGRAGAASVWVDVGAVSDWVGMKLVVLLRRGVGVQCYIFVLFGRLGARSNNVGLGPEEIRPSWNLVRRDSVASEPGMFWLR